MKKKTRKLVVILVVIAVVSITAFAISVAVFGVKDGNWGVNFNGGEIMGFNFGSSRIYFKNGSTDITFDYEPGKSYYMDFEKDNINDIELVTLSAETSVSTTSGDTAKVTYTASDKNVGGIEVVCTNGKLSVKELAGTNIFSWNSTKPKIEILLPEKKYENVKVAGASGSVGIKGLTAQSFDSKIGSGEHEYTLFAEETSLNIASGKAELNSLVGEKAEKFNVNIASGNVDCNYPADELKINVASGKANIKGASGDTDIELTSGQLNVDFDEWNGDLKINTTSGKAEVTLPEGSGADVTIKRTSGKASVTLDGQYMSDSGSARIGGANTHDINISLTSGKVDIHN